MRHADNKTSLNCEACGLDVDIIRGLCSTESGMVILKRQGKSMEKVLIGRERVSINNFTHDAKTRGILDKNCDSHSLAGKIEGMLLNSD